MRETCFKMCEKLIDNFHMNPFIPAHDPLDYGGHPEKRDVVLDCSLGVNPAPLEKEILSSVSFAAKDGLLEKLIKDYPHDDSVKGALADWFQRQRAGREWIRDGCFVPGNGSYGILCAINQLFLGPGRRVLGVSPQFTAYIDSVCCAGAEYDTFLLKEADNYRFNGKRFRGAMSEAYDLFILENPNNPTGQAIPLEEIALTAKRAKELGRVLVVDEAYGDYLDPDQTAIDLIPEYDNLIVTRSFSKGFGVAGIRFGYAVVSPAGGIAAELEKAAIPFQCNNFARYLAAEALKTKAGLKDPFGVAGIRKEKAVLAELLSSLKKETGRCLSMAETEPSVPIFMLHIGDVSASGHEDPEAEKPDLYELFMEAGILTVSCATYPGLGKHAVRLMLPPEEKLPVLLEAIKKVSAEIS